MLFKKSFILILVLIAGKALAQPVYFQSFFGDTSSQCVGKSINMGHDGSLYFTGNFNNFVTGQQGIEMYKLDTAGNIIWQKIICTGYYYANRTMINHNLEIVIAGQYTDSTGNINALAIKLDSAGNVLFFQTYGNINTTESFQGLNYCADSSLIFSGFITNPAGAGNAFWILKSDAAGNEQWQQTYYYNVNSTCDDIFQTADGGYIMSGDKKTNTSNYNIHIIKTDSAGFIEWETDISHPFNSGCKNMIRNSEGNYIIIGETATPTSAYFDPFITKIDSTGAIIWSHVIPCSDNPDAGYDIFENPNGSYTITGFGYDTTRATTDMLVMTLDTGGFEISRLYFGDDGYDQGFSIMPDMSGTGFYAAGMATISSTARYLLVHDILPVTTSIAESQPQIDIKIYPQPANQFITISTDINKDNNHFKLLSVTGKLINEIRLENNSTNIETTSFPSGIYIGELTTRNGTLRKKIIITH